MTRRRGRGTPPRDPATVFPAPLESAEPTPVESAGTSGGVVGPPPLAVALASLTDQPGVYLLRDRQGRVLYVGKATSLRQRVRSYFQPGQDHTPRIRWMLDRVHSLETLVVGTPLEALMLECNLIKQHRPYFNVKYRDDKRYPLLEVTTSEPYPRLRIVRTRRNHQNRFFGPFPDAGALRRTVKILQSVFRIRTCKVDMRKPLERPCLDYFIELCTAPCARLVPPEEYRRQVDQALKFLEGHTDELLRSLHQEMEREAARLNFERCARVRNMIADLERSSERHRVVLADPQDEDYVTLTTHRDLVGVYLMQVREGRLVGQHPMVLETHGETDAAAQMAAFLKQYYQPGSFVPRRVLVNALPEEDALLGDWLASLRGSRVEIRSPQRGEKRRMLELCLENAARALSEEALMPSRFEKRRRGLDQLRLALELADPPWRIECVDISNTQGRQAVGSLVVFEHGLPRREHYRRFRIQSGDTPDDFRMMREVLARRFRSTDERKFPALPDLLVVDGGKGQLNAAVQVLNELELEGQVPVAALAKENEWLFRPGRSEPIVLARGTDGLAVVTHLRDEAHRFAVTYHRKVRARAFQASHLEEAPGIGKERRQSLLRHFGSLARLQCASLEELAAAPGIGARLAESLFSFLHPDSPAMARSARGQP